jgi:hypothetical protein
MKDEGRPARTAPENTTIAECSTGVGTWAIA